MSSDFQVDAEALRTAAAAVTGLAGRVSTAATAGPAIEPASPWATAAAGATAAGTARRLVDVLDHDVADTADRMRAVAGDYEEADTRAAARLGSAR